MRHHPVGPRSRRHRRCRWHPLRCGNNKEEESLRQRRHRGRVPWLGYDGLLIIEDGKVFPKQHTENPIAVFPFHRLFLWQ